MLPKPHVLGASLFYSQVSQNPRPCWLQATVPIQGTVALQNFTGQKYRGGQNFPGIYQEGSLAILQTQGRGRDPLDSPHSLPAAGMPGESIHNDISLGYPPSSELPQPETVSTHLCTGALCGFLLH